MVETYNVSWGSYSEHVANMLQDLTASNEFADVTLVCADMVIIQAHKLVLSACSKFFQFLLKEACNSDSKPIIYLKGIHSREMSHLLQFMYRGETSFPEDATNSFLNVANELQIKAFSYNSGEKLEENEQNSVTKYESTPPQAIPKVEQLSSISHQLNDKEDLSPLVKDFNIEIAKSETPEKKDKDKTQNAIAVISTNFPKEGEQNTNKHQVDNLSSAKVKIPDVAWMKRLEIKNYCDLCGFKSSIDSKKHIRIHKITKHKYKLCSNCEFIAPDKDILNQHMIEVHSETSKSNSFIVSKTNSNLKCEQCDFITETQRLLKQHTTMKHDGYRRLSQLKDKFVIVEKDNSKLYSCKECEYENPYTTNIKRHIETKHLDMNFQCDQCGYIGTRLQSLRHHINTVHEKVQRKCTQCDEKFIHYEALKAHVDNVHLGITYDCKQCRSVFTRPGNLNKHVRLFH